VQEAAIGMRVRIVCIERQRLFDLCARGIVSAGFNRNEAAFDDGSDMVWFVASDFRLMILRQAFAASANLPLRCRANANLQILDFVTPKRFGILLKARNGGARLNASLDAKRPWHAAACAGRVWQPRVLVAPVPFRKERMSEAVGLLRDILCVGRII